MKLKILLSYAYYLKQKSSAMKFFKKNKNDIELLIDSGAYTAYTQGTKINLAEYMDFITMLQETGIKFDYFTLDSIGNPAKTLRLFNTMLAKGYDPIPIFQRGAEPKDLNHYYEINHLVALGGISLNVNNTSGYVKYIMNNHIKKRKVHWLGWSTRDFLLHYKPYSFDSSSASVGNRFGNIMYLKNNQLLTYDNNSNKTPPPEVRKLITMTGKNPKDELSWRGGNLPNIPMECTYITYIKYMILLKQKLNINLHLVDSAVFNLQILVDTFKKFKEVL